MKRKQPWLFRVIDISKKKREKRKEKRKEKINILVVRLWPMKRKELGLLCVIDISKIER